VREQKYVHYFISPSFRENRSVEGFTFGLMRKYLFFVSIRVLLKDISRTDGSGHVPAILFPERSSAIV
jgi:hypothetical protein